MLKANLSWELIIANDESGDSTEQVCSQLTETYPIRLLNRTSNRGLSLAVIDGVKLASGEIIVVMDADMSHPPAAVNEMVKLLDSSQVDMVVGSRNVVGSGTDETWSLFRHLNTFIATLLAKPLTSIRDPMSGFFALRTCDWPSGKLDPIGYKIGLDVLVRARLGRDRVREIPIFFTDRKIGESKLSLKEQLNYMHHLSRLYRFRFPSLVEILLFCLVGASGMLVDIAGYLILVTNGVNHEIARAVSFWPATLNNWFLNRKFTFRDAKNTASVPQAIRYSLVTLVGFAVNWGVFTLLVRNSELFNEYKIVALIIGVICGLVVNFIGAKVFAFASTNKKR